MSFCQELRGTNAVFPASCFCFLSFLARRSLPPDSCSTSSFSPASLSADSGRRSFARASAGRACALGRRTAPAGRWRARRPERRGSPGPAPPARASPPPRGRGAAARASPAQPSRGSPEQPAGPVLPSGSRPPRGPRRRRASARGARARRPGSMSQQQPARSLPSLLVDPAEETVRRRCRDPINVEGLLVGAGRPARCAPGPGAGPGSGGGARWAGAGPGVGAGPG